MTIPPANKVATGEGWCEIRDISGNVIVRAEGRSSYHAVRNMKNLITALEAERHGQAKRPG